MQIQNIYAGMPAELPEELTQTLLQRKNVRIERIISQGQASPEGFWYDQDEHEWVLLLQGAARLAFEGEERAHEMNTGDYILIPAHCRHRVDWTAPDIATIWLAVFFRDEVRSTHSGCAGNL